MLSAHKTQIHLDYEFIMQRILLDLTRRKLVQLFSLGLRCVEQKKRCQNMSNKGQANGKSFCLKFQ